MSGRRPFGNVRKLPSGRWQARYRDTAGREHAATFAAKGDASRYLARAQADLERGEWRDPRLGRVTFAEWAEEYLAGAVHKAASTLAQDRARLRKHLLPHFGTLPLGSITPLDVRRFVEGMAAQGYAPATVKRTYGCFHGILAAAVAADVLAASPCRGVRLPAKRPGDKRVVSVEELGRLAEALPAEYRAMPYVAAFCGLRWSEVAGLRVGRVDFLRGVLHVTETFSEHGGFTKPKTPASRAAVPVPRAVLDMLAAHLRRRGRPGPDALVFAAPAGGPLRIANFRKRVWVPAVARAGLGGLTFHGLRHSTVALMVELGEHPLVISRRLRHASIGTTMDVYGHLFDALDAGATQRLDGLLSKPVATERRPG